MRPFLGVIKSIPSLTSWIQMIFSCRFFFGCLASNWFDRKWVEDPFSRSAPHRSEWATKKRISNNEVLPQDFFGTNQPNLYKCCKSRVYEHEFFQCFFIEPTKKYLVILFISSFRNTLFGSHFFDRSKHAGIDWKVQIHTSATSRATEKKGRWMHAYHAIVAAWGTFGRKSLPKGKDLHLKEARKQNR